MDSLTFKHPFTCVVSGPTGSGKTEFIRRVLKNNNILISNITYPIKVLWSYGQYQSLYNVPNSMKNVIILYTDGLPSEQKINEFKPNIVVIDDLMLELS